MAELKIELEHVLGTRHLPSTAATVDEVLAQNGIPRTMVQTYFLRGERMSVIPGWTRLDEVPADVDVVLVRALRNTLFDTILPWAPGPALPAGYGVGFQAIATEPGGRAVRHGTVLDETAAKALVSGEVGEFVEEYAVAERGCVFGVSGGGDSNALAYGLSAALPPEHLTAFTLVFADVMTRAAADRATVLCQDLGIDHRVYSEVDTALLLGMTTSLDQLYSDFSDAFGTEALHFFGTFLILKAARAIGRQSGFTDLAFGYNREDLLAELLFMIMNGRAPLSYPVRQIGEQRIVMPVWKAPKLLLDACHPSFSMENYRERDAHTTRQRSLAFYLGHSLDSVYPSFGTSFLDGASRAFAGHFGELRHYRELDVFVTSDATPERLDRVAAVLRRHFPGEQTA
ncbi:hypothetical protein E3O45_02650 [Cryobacterium sp. TMS1-20-1]|uniref:hypothetical protein n=1 Tax=Cryobacterium sp. TMS1-20-1 TaxID=1259223 RepID=UPI00106DA56B|nr:hypothetical protein [Cryobacterium sp. TMS1-20-1]TFC80060.1 hypothetical protein E3O45_02650 [Cryobacterium sp. TMS1-20-1]